MINSDVRESIITKAEQAQECVTKSFQLCDDYSRTKNQKHLKNIGGYLGTFVNNLRSGLNYAMGDYCEQRSFKKSKKGKDLSTDFPTASTKENFNRTPIVSLMSQSDPQLYTFVEGMQPYYPNNDLLSNIINISNMDKHTVLIKVQEMDINDFIVVDADDNFFVPQHWGNTVVTGISNGKPVLVETPTYVHQMRMYALPNGKWLNFMIPIDDHFLEFIPFMANTANKVIQIINQFYSLWD